MIVSPIAAMAENRTYEEDTFSPAIPGDFVEVKREEVKEEISYSVVLYERKRD